MMPWVFRKRQREEWTYDLKGIPQYIYFLEELSSERDKRKPDWLVMALDSIVGYDDDGQPVNFNSSDYRITARRLHEILKPPAHIRLRYLGKKLDKMQDIYPHPLGLVISERVKTVIEQFNIPNTEFLEAESIEFEGNLFYDYKYYYMNVYHWVDCIDYVRSKLYWREVDDLPDMMLNNISIMDNAYRFGTKIWRMDGSYGQPPELVGFRGTDVILKDNFFDYDLFRIMTPNESYYSRIVISSRLVHALRDHGFDVEYSRQSLQIPAFKVPGHMHHYWKHPEIKD